MDKIKVSANQRFDLTDMLRFIDTFLPEGIGHLISKLLGNANYYTGTPDARKRPIIVKNFDMSTATLTVTINRTWSTDEEAIIFDKDGYRLTGPNSQTTDTYIVTSTPTAVDRYLIARRVDKETSSEARAFYTAVLGRYTANTNTKIVDEWEVSEMNAEFGSNVSAASHATAQNSGWVDIATFQSNGTIISSFTPKDATVFEYASPITAGATTTAWYRNYFDYIVGLGQLASRLRDDRKWYTDFRYDAAFEEEGGIRFAGGGTASQGLKDAFLRVVGSSYNMIRASQDTVPTAASLIFIRGKGIIAGDSSGLPDPTNQSGFLYSTSTTDPTSLKVVNKYINIDACDFMPGEYGASSSPADGHPWSDPAITALTNFWYISESVTGTYGNEFGYRIETTVGSSGTWFGPYLYIPLSCLMDGSRLTNITVTIEVDVGGMAAAHKVGVALVKKTLSTGNAADITTGTPATYNLSAGIQTVSAAATETVNNSLYTYYAVIAQSSTAALTAEDTIRIHGAIVTTQIREASHVY